MKPFQGVAICLTDDHPPPLLKSSWGKPRRKLRLRLAECAASQRGAFQRLRKTKKKPLTRLFAEKLGGLVTNDWSKATFLVGDDVQSEKAQEALGNGFLLFSSNFLVQCMAQERVVNAGPFILHQTVVRDESRPEEDEPAALPSPARLGKKTAKRGKRGAAAAAEEDESELGQLVAMLEDVSSPEGTRCIGL